MIQYDPLVGDGTFLLAAYQTLLGCDCPCHKVVQPGLGSCPRCDPGPESSPPEAAA